MRRVVPSMLLALALTAALRAAASPQDAATGPSFEVASVKPNTSGSDRLSISFPPQGQITVVNMPLRMIIAWAYNVPTTLLRFVVVGGPNEILDARFDITAKPPDGTPPRQNLPMLKGLLAERFKLRLKPDTRQVPVYALTLARADGALGPEMRPSAHDCAALMLAPRDTSDPDAPRDWKGRSLCRSNNDFDPLGPGTRGVRFAGPIAQMLPRLQGLLDRPVIDRTGLAGNFEWTVTFASNPLQPADAPPLEVAVREQLGLELRRETGPVDVLVVEAVERPAPD